MFLAVNNTSFLILSAESKKGLLGHVTDLNDAKGEYDFQGNVAGKNHDCDYAREFGRLKEEREPASPPANIRKASAIPAFPDRKSLFGNHPSQIQEESEDDSLDESSEGVEEGEDEGEEENLRKDYSSGVLNKPVEISTEKRSNLDGTNMGSYYPQQLNYGEDDTRLLKHLSSNRNINNFFHLPGGIEDHDSTNNNSKIASPKDFN